MNRVFPALRGLAILLVVMNHTIHMGMKYPRAIGLVNSTWEEVLLYFFSGFGIIAVPIFLYLSGCFFSYAFREGDLRSHYLIVWKNLGIIFFPYLIWSLIFYLEIFLVHGSGCTPLQCVKNIIVGYPYNFVPLMFFYYLLAPILMILVDKFGWRLVAIIGFMQLLLLNVVHPGVLGFNFPAWINGLAPPVLANSLAEWAVFFPLGLTYSRKMSSYMPFAKRYQWVLIGIIIGLYLLALLDILGIIKLPIARYLCPFFFMLVAPLINRNSIPFVKTVEGLGRRAYGIYFMNLIVLDLLTLGLQRVAPGVYKAYFLVLIVLFFLAIQIPVWTMKLAERFQKIPIYRYVFG